MTARVPALGAFLTLVWVILFIVLVCKLLFVPLLLLDRRMGFAEALRMSWTMTRGHEWQVFFIGLLGVLMLAAVGIIAFIVSLIFVVLPVVLLVGIVIGVIGTIFISMWLMATYASLYRAVSN